MRDELIALAKEAGSSIVGGVDGNDTQCWTGDIAFGEDELERFAALVAAKEREECAGICERFYAREMNAAECAAAIRARKP